MLRVAINGFGRIGRSILRAVHERRTPDLEIVAINELADAESIAHLTRYDSTHGRFPGNVQLQDGSLCVDDRTIRLYHDPSLASIDWRVQQVDLVMECSGTMQAREEIEQHLAAGASGVLLSYPVRAEAVDQTVIYGVNHQILELPAHTVSAASCTTNCIVPVIDALDRAFGIESGIIRTLHSAMNDQHVTDAYHPEDLRKARAAFASFVPVETELARGIERILPQLSGRFTAQAMRLPVIDVSAIDLAVVLGRDTDADEVNRVLEEAAGGYRGVLAVTRERLASCDFVHDPHSGIVDATQTTMAGPRLARLLVWFDNEWGYANRMLDTALAWSRFH